MAEPVVDPNAPVVDPNNPNPTEQPEKDWKQEYDKAIEHARTWETRAKTNVAEANANKAAAEELAKIKASQLTESERLQAERDAAVARAEHAEKVSRTQVVQSAVRELAATQGFHNPADALALLGNEIASVQLDDKGEFDRSAIQAALTTLATDRPYLVNAAGPQRPQPDSGQGARPTTGTKTEQDALYDFFFPAKTTT